MSGWIPESCHRYVDYDRRNHCKNHNQHIKDRVKEQNLKKQQIVQMLSAMDTKPFQVEVHPDDYKGE